MSSAPGHDDSYVALPTKQELQGANLTEGYAAGEAAVAADEAANYVEAAELYQKALNLLEGAGGPGGKLESLTESYRKRMAVIQRLGPGVSPSPAKYMKAMSMPGLAPGERARTASMETSAKPGSAKVPPIPPSAPEPKSIDGTRSHPLSEMFDGGLKFREVEPSGPLPPPPPTSEAMKPLWLLTTIGRTLSMETGAYLTPKLYVPKEVWNQPSAMLVALAVKSEALSSVAGLLSTLGSAHRSGEESAMKEALYGALSALDDIQTNLSAHLPFIEAPVKGPAPVPTSTAAAFGARLKSFTSAVGKSATRLRSGVVKERLGEPSGESYIASISEVANTVPDLEAWIREVVAIVDPKNPDPTARTAATVTLARLGSVSKFLTNVLCPVILTDLLLLLERYMEHNRKLFTTVPRAVLVDLEEEAAPARPETMNRE